MGGSHPGKKEKGATICQLLFVETAKTIESAKMKKNALKILAKENESFTIIQFAEEAEKKTFVDNIKQLKFPFVEAR